MKLCICVLTWVKKSRDSDAKKSIFDYSSEEIVLWNKPNDHVMVIWLENQSKRYTRKSLRHTLKNDFAPKKEITWKQYEGA